MEETTAAGIPSQGERESHNLIDLHRGRVDLTVELGRMELELGEVIQLREQDIIVVNRLAGESLLLWVNGQPFALGQIVVSGDWLAFRVTGFVPGVERGTS